MTDKLTDADRDAKGVEAIIYLQKMVGIEETEESAKAGWDSLDEHQQANTLVFHKMLHQVFGEEGHDEPIKMAVVTGFKDGKLQGYQYGQTDSEADAEDRHEDYLDSLEDAADRAED